MRRFHRSLFVTVLFITFFVSTPIVVFVSQGYRIDTTNWKIVQTGGLHLKTKPTDVSLTMNGKQKRTLSPRFLYNGTILKNLLPGTYELTVTASSSLPWKKSVEISPALVSKATRVALPVASPAIKFLQQIPSTTNIIFSKLETIFLESNDKKSVSSLSLDRPNSMAPVFPAPDSKTNLEKSEIISEVIPSASLHNIIVKTTHHYYLVKDNQTTVLDQLTSSIAKQNNSAKITFFWHPTDDEILFVSGAHRSYWIALPDMLLRPLSQEKIIGWNQNGSRAFLMSASGILSGFSTQAQPTSTPLASIDPTLFSRFPLAIHDLGENRFIIHEPSGMLLLLDINREHSELIDPAVTMLSISENASHLVYLTNDHKLLAYFLEPTFDDSRYNLYEKVFLAQIPDDTQPLEMNFANDNWYAALTTEWGVLMVEIDKRQPVNQWIISFEKKINPVLFQARNAALVWQEKNKLFTAQLLP